MAKFFWPGNRKKRQTNYWQNTHLPPIHPLLFLQAGEYVLLEGTGGVSTFGLLFAAAAGAKPIITSSRNEKLERARELGAVGTVNYRENPDWQKEVRELRSEIR